jgi:hypothetical protein
MSNESISFLGNNLLSCLVLWVLIQSGSQEDVRADLIG